MTIDYTPPDRQPIATLSTIANQPRLLSASLPAFAVWNRPTADELAALMAELLVEGALNRDHFQAFLSLPDIGPLLAKNLGERPWNRKVLAAE